VQSFMIAKYYRIKSDDGHQICKRDDGWACVWATRWLRALTLY
jgi:hypothetical protein